MFKAMVFFICTSMHVIAQIEVPNGDFEKFKTMNLTNLTYDLPVDWNEHQKNTYQRIIDGHGCVYKYSLPDANGTALALYRGSSYSHITKENGIFTSFLIPKKNESLRLEGRYKFSGSDIEQAIDTLKIVVFSTPKPFIKVSDTLPKNANVLDLVVPTSHFERFYLDLNTVEKNHYVTIIMQLKSGSDDDYYWGYANAVIDDLKFISTQDITEVNQTYLTNN